MAKKQKPHHVTVNGIKYTLAIFEVTHKFPNGSPRHCTRIPDQGTVRLDNTPEPKEFMTAYIPAVMLQK